MKDAGADNDDFNAYFENFERLECKIMRYRNENCDGFNKKL